MSMVRALIASTFLLLLAPWAQAQCPVPADDAPPKLPVDVSRATDGEGLLPESGYLSEHTYTSLFFGFGLDLPIPVEGHRMMLPLMPPGQHALLSLAVQEAAHHGSLTITAAEPTNPTYALTEKERREEFQRWAQNKPALRQSEPDFMMRSGHFEHLEQRKGDMVTLQYSTRIKNYRLRIVIVTNDTEFLRSARQAVETIHIYCPQEDGTVTNSKGEAVTPEGTPYEGPTIPTARVDARLAEKPEEHAIPAGAVTEGVYRNPDLGLDYTLPTGWIVLNSSISREDAKANPTEQRIHDFLHACSRVLVRASKQSSAGADHEALPTIELRALDSTCLSLHGPNTVDDQLGAEYLGAYLGMLGEFGEIQTADLITASGRVFAVYRGTIGKHGSDQELKMRDSEMILATRYNKLLLLWSLILPQGMSWTDMPDTRVRFGGKETIELGPALAKK